MPVNFHVKQDLAPEASGYYVDQHLALSVLDPNVPIPASLDPNAGVGLWFPAWKVGDERAGSYGTSGAMILINGDWQANGERRQGAADPGPADGPGPPRQRIAQPALQPVRGVPGGSSSSKAARSRREHSPSAAPRQGPSLTAAPRSRSAPARRARSGRP